jgi:hypothetical protein
MKSKVTKKGGKVSCRATSHNSSQIQVYNGRVENPVGKAIVDAELRRHIKRTLDQLPSDVLEEIVVWCKSPLMIAAVCRRLYSIIFSSARVWLSPTPKNIIEFPGASTFWASSSLWMPAIPGCSTGDSSDEDVFDDGENVHGKEDGAVTVQVKVRQRNGGGKNSRKKRRKKKCVIHHREYLYWNGKSRDDENSVHSIRKLSTLDLGRWDSLHISAVLHHASYPLRKKISHVSFPSWAKSPTSFHPDHLLSTMLDTTRFPRLRALSIPYWSLRAVAAVGDISLSALAHPVRLVIDGHPPIHPVSVFDHFLDSWIIHMEGLEQALLELVYLTRDRSIPNAAHETMMPPHYQERSCFQHIRRSSPYLSWTKCKICKERYSSPSPCTPVDPDMSPSPVSMRSITAAALAAAAAATASIHCMPLVPGTLDPLDPLTTLSALTAPFSALFDQHQTQEHHTALSFHENSTFTSSFR